MMAKRLITSFVLLACIVLVGCGKRDDEVNAMIKDLDSFTTEVAGKLSSAKDLASGLMEARKYFDAKKADIKKKFDSIKDIRGFQISEDTKKKMEDAITKNVTSIASLQITYMSRTVEDKNFETGLEKLINDYQDLLKG
jgi:hypothetical protein